MARCADTTGVDAVMELIMQEGFEGLGGAVCTLINGRSRSPECAARIRITVRKVWLSYSGAYPYASDFAQILANLRRHPAWAPPG